MGLGYVRVAGVDEVGLGPWAGPVVAAAVVFPPRARVIAGVDDSKKLTPARREALAAEIRDCAAGVALGIVEVADLDALGVHEAGLEAMRRAVCALSSAAGLPAGRCATRARRRDGTDVLRACRCVHLLGGCGLDRCEGPPRRPDDRDGRPLPRLWLRSAHGIRHRAPITTRSERLGPCEIHRRSFAPVRRVVAGARGRANRQRLSRQRKRRRRREIAPVGLLFYGRLLGRRRAAAQTTRIRMTLYDHPDCPYGMKVRIVLAEKDMDLRW